MAVDRTRNKKKTEKQAVAGAAISADAGPHDVSNVSGEGVKHLIECTCILPQYLTYREPIYHKFAVFSIIKDDKVVEKYVQCNNCGIIHRVYDICASEIKHGKDELGSIRTIDEIRLAIPDKISALLDANDCDLATWEQTEYIIDNASWSDIIVLKSEHLDTKRVGKYIAFNDEGKPSVLNFDEYVV